MIYNVRLTTLSPINIGTDSNQTLSPYADFFLENDDVHYISHRAIEKAIDGKRDLIDAYVLGITKGIDNQTRSTFSIKNFITTKLKLDLDAVTKVIIPNKGLKPNNRRQVMSTIKTADRPYIPGSSIKGALRTAILYDWYINTEPGAALLNTLIEDINKTYDLHYAKIEKLLKQKRRRRLEKYEFEELKSAEKIIKQAAKKWFDEETLFGELKNKDAVIWSQFLHVSDTETLDNSNLAIYQAERIRLTKANEKRKGSSGSIPQPKETLDTNTQTRFKITVRSKIFDHPSFIFLKDKNKIKEYINAFSKDCIYHELSQLEEAIYETPNRREINDLIRFYADMEKEMEDSDCIYLRLGSGKTYYDNSLGLALLNHRDGDNDDGEKSEEAFRKLGQMLLGKFNPKGTFYPVTRTVTIQEDEDAQPLGWVKLELV